MRRTPLSFLFASVVMLAAASASAQAPAPSPYPAPPPGAAPVPYYGGYYYAPPPRWGAPTTVFVDPDEGGTERRSPAMMITGFTMAGVGLGALITGAFAFVAASSVQYEVGCLEGPCNGAYYGSSPDVGGPVAAMIAGVALIGVGVPVGVVGSRSKPKDRTENASSAVPEVAIGTSSAKLRWSF